MKAPRGKPVRIAAAVVLAVLGLAMAMEIFAIGFGQTAVDARAASLAVSVRPENARGAALLAGEALAAGELDRAERLARSALAENPFDVVAIRTLGQVRNAREPGAGDALMLLAGSLGWRDIPTQVWLLDRAVRAGETRIAVERAEALVRLQRETQIAFTMFRMLAHDPEARALIVASLAERPMWRHNFFGAAPIADLEREGTVLLLEGLARTDAPPSIAEARSTIDALAAAERADRAWQLYRAVSGRVPDGALMANEGFEDEVDYQQGAAATTFDWRVYSLDGGTAGVEPEPGRPGNKVLFAVAEGTTRTRVAERTLMLPPGEYRLSYRIRSDDPRAPESLKYHLYCAGGATVVKTGDEPLRSSGWETRTARFAVPPGCRPQVLELLVEPGGEFGETEAFFDDFTIRRAG